MAFNISTYDLLKTQIWPASALDKVVTFAGEVLFERNPPTSIRTKATPGERSDLRMSGQPEVPLTEDEKAA